MLEVMGHLRDVRKRTDSAEAMFEPLKNTVSLLSKHGVSISGDVVSSLDNIISNSWNSLKKKATLTKEQHSNRQSQEAEQVKRDAKEFEFRAEEFFNFFKKNMPYEYSVDWEAAYDAIDRIHHNSPDDPANPLPHGSLIEIRKDAVRLNASQIF